MIRSVKVVILVVFLAKTIAVDESEWDLVQPAKNSTQCIYKSKSQMLICRGSIGFVECSAISSLPIGFDVFGLSNQKDENISIGTQKFALYPRVLNETVYQEKLEGEKNVSISHLQWDDVGLRIPSEKCWARLVELFNATKEKHQAQVEQSESRVSLFGEILVIGRHANKRWMGLWRWSLALRFGLGFGWGFGWGIPPFALLV